MDCWTLILTLLAVILVLYHYFLRENKFVKLGILHLKPLPIVGNMADVLLNRCPLVDTIDKAYNLNRDAAYVGFYDFSNPVTMLRSPKLIKDITVKYSDHFIDHCKIVDANQDAVFGINLFSQSGDKWKEIRSLLTPAFTSSKMKVMYKLMSDCAINFASYLDKSCATGPNVIDAKDAFTRYTNDVIATCSFGISVDSMRNPNNEFYVIGRKTTSLEGIMGMKFFFLKSFPKLSKYLKLKLIDVHAENFFNNMVKETIETRDRLGITRPDMMQIMMETRANKDGLPALTVKEMAAHAFSFFFGGFESSSTSVCFATYELAVNTDVQKRLQDEIDAVMADHNGEPTYEAINEMQYLEAVITEALRKYFGAAFLDRLCVKTFVLPPALPGGKSVTVNPGETVWIPAFSIQRDPDYYPDPDKFDPERFLGSRKNDIDPFTYLPFGQGPRGCIGTRFALLESKVVIFHLLARCHLTVSPKTVVPMVFKKGNFIVTPKDGFWLELETRNTAVTNSS